MPPYVPSMLIKVGGSYQTKVLVVLFVVCFVYLYCIKELLLAHSSKTGAQFSRPLDCYYQLRRSLFCFFRREAVFLLNKGVCSLVFLSEEGEREKEGRESNCGRQL